MVACFLPSFSSRETVPSWSAAMELEEPPVVLPRLKEKLFENDWVVPPGATVTEPPTPRPG